MLAFTTLAPPTVTTSAATRVTDTSATLNGAANANGLSTTVTFEYGLDSSYGAQVTAEQSPVTRTTGTAVSQTIISLAPNTTYHYRVVGINADGTTTGSDQTFTTLVSTTTTITSTQNPSTVGQSVTFTATVSPMPDSGTVTFKDGGTVISGCEARPLTSGQATCTVVALTLGAHTITAVYDDDANHKGSTSEPVTQVVNQAPTIITRVYLPLLSR